jgi:nanoRNase/pAp phosphatase (c-di-AMP/oligoRNAs hydrolase)
MENLTANEKDQLIQQRYQKAIGYYWTASKFNKRWYKLTRSLTVIFGALVTLIASLTSSEIITGHAVIENLFALGTPVLAALLTIIAGFSQSFQWGSTWQNMVITAQELQMEYDKYLVTAEAERNYLEEAEKLNTYVITESQSFFEKMLGSAMPTKKAENQVKN